MHSDDGTQNEEVIGSNANCLSSRGAIPTSWIARVSSKVPDVVARCASRAAHLLVQYTNRHVHIPGNPWDRYPYINVKRYEGKLTCGTRFRPLTLNCETVNTCNNACVICACSEQTRKKISMSMSIFEKVVQDYSSMGGGHMSLTPIVGDILMDRDILERLRILESHPGIDDLSVTTNASLAHRFDDSELRYFVSRFSRIQISIYGLDAEEYREMTKRKTYDQMVTGIRRFLQVGADKVTFSFRLLRQWTRRDVDAWLDRTIYANLAGRAITTEPRPINSLMTGGYANWGVLDTSKPLPFNASWCPPRVNKTQCMLPILSFLVYSNGNVSFCPCDNFDDVEELSLGNIKDATLLELYNTPKAKALWNWKEHGVPGFCKRCTFHIPIQYLRLSREALDDPFKIMGG